MRPYAEGVASMLPGLWEEAEDAPMLQTAIFNLVTVLLEVCRIFGLAAVACHWRGNERLTPHLCIVHFFSLRGPYSFKGLGPRSSVLHGMVVPFVLYGTDMSNPAHEYLLESALNIW